MSGDDKQITVLVANTIYDLKQKFGETRITADTIHIVIKEVIELVEKFVISGSEKKKHVIVIVKSLVEDLVDDENEKRIITEMIDKKILENTIDLIILATKGQLDINNKKTKTTLISCFKTSIPLTIDTIVHFVESRKKSESKEKNTVIVKEVETEPKREVETEPKREVETEANDKI